MRRSKPAPDERAEEAVASLRRLSTQKDLDNLARFGITATEPIGVSMASIQKVARELGRSHELAAGLWDTGFYEARMLAAFVDEPAEVTPAQMDRWCGDFDSWALCDTLCFCLFDRTPHAFAKVRQWSDAPEELGKRAAFALLASLAGHDETTGDGPFLDGLALVERASTDERSFVRKGVLWALRSVGRRNTTLEAAALALARRLSASADRTARWIGKTALREMTKSSSRKATRKKGKKEST